MISASVAIISIVLILVGLLIQPSFVLIVGICMSYNIWTITRAEGPRERLENLIVALQNQDEEAVRSLSSERLEEGIDMLFSAMSGSNGASFLSILGEARITECTILDAETATCTICMSQLDNCDNITLIKEDNLWVVDLEK